MKDLFGNEITEEQQRVAGNPDRRYRNARGSAAPIGSGPPGETCASCKNCYLHHTNGAKRWYKCKLLKPTHGAATDIRLKWAACSRFEKKETEA